MRFGGVDASSKSFAWAVIEDDNLIEFGEIFFMNADFTRRLAEARVKLEAFIDIIFDGVDYIGFEKPVSVNNRVTAIKLAKMAGVIESILIDCDAKLVEVPPISWQTAIGNPSISGKNKTEFLKLHPEFKTRSQVNNGIRMHRKNVTRNIVNEKFDELIDSDNICDAVGVALFIQEKL